MCTKLQFNEQKKYFHKRCFFYLKVSQVLNGMTWIVHKNPNWHVQLQSNGQFSWTQHAIKSSQASLHFFRVVQYVRNLMFFHALYHVVKTLIPLCLFALPDDITMNIFGKLTRILNGKIKLRRSAWIPSTPADWPACWTRALLAIHFLWDDLIFLCCVRREYCGLLDVKYSAQ